METLTLPEVEEEDFYEVEAVDITGTNVVTMSKLNPSTTAQNLAGILASRLHLPTNIPWMLRSDRSGAFLEEDAPISDQIDNKERVVLSPKTHLGAFDNSN